jgi:transposase
MPYKSKAQAAKFHAMAARGQISQTTVSEWDAATKRQGTKLPNKAKSKK